ncbi:amidophosphoribosyltransferase [Lederbergia galactosidilytica]|uniref:Amidophosphoribosyltransferase n=1 Tax=Lederbergia galactosidilytica TaxID=217031 RepID=A0A177ZSN2_9BACI|nr:amidophosphoribosyltransferase [Lederbergia galactosidilytica]KRG14367.1 amidophosphoribosyltransferase [Virgibacillus soli]MBP1916683.1 amidophosphoribosyltransferase [Lederbergia galactosidilytica]OAK70946.1 amidophosphoribosyltransferase [Lederbergia galactosidilytica]
MFADIKGLNEECGVFGIWGHPDAVQITYYGLHSLQHRGQEGAGIVATDGNSLKGIRGEGLVNDVFNKSNLASLPGQNAIGHVKYGGADKGGLENVQPLLFHSSSGSLALAQNGNLINALDLKHQLEMQGSIFQSTSDTEVLAHLIKRSGYLATKDKVKNALSMVKGAYALALLTEEELIIALDPNGLRPLSIGRIGDAYCVSSETCAFDLIGAEFVRDVEPGELIIINDEGLYSEPFSLSTSSAMCSMEYVYFSRPDSDIQGINIHTARKNLGKVLAKEVNIDADVVTGVPDSSISAAIGFAETTGIPYEIGLIKNRYVGRTFIKPSQELREQGVKMKLSPVRKVVEGKRVVMVDDSIVRGTTSKRIVKMLKEAGATEVHVCISSPPMKHPCFYGIDVSSHEELMASAHSVDEMCDIIGADSLTFLSVEGMLEAIGRKGYGKNCGQCTACFTGEYPTEIYPDTLLPYEKEMSRS